MKKNKSWMSIVLAMWLVMIIIMTAQFILSYIIPFSKATKWIENASIAYYIAYSWIEEAMWFKSQNNIWAETWVTMPSTNQWMSFKIEATWALIPPLNWWNSDFNKNRNKINANAPIQLILYDADLKKIDDINFDKTTFKFYVPDLDWTNLSFSWGSDYEVINWQLSWSWNTVNATGSTNRITWDEINDSVDNTNYEINIWWLLWVDLDWTEDQLKDWWNNQIWTDDLPVLKLSIINKLEWQKWANWWNLPYLEYDIKVEDINWDNVKIPTRYTRVKTSWKSYWFQKNLEFRIPQITTNQAFDFTVFQ